MNKQNFLLLICEPFTAQASIMTTLRKKHVENIVRIGEIADDQGL